MVQINSTLKNKLRNYSILAGSALAAATTADGQIVHTNVTPVKVLVAPKSNYTFDLNGDGNLDFGFARLNNPGGTIFGVMDIQNKSASFEGSIDTFASGPKVGYPYVVNSGDKIGASAKWDGFSNLKFGSKSTVDYANLGVSYMSKFYGNWGTGDSLKFVGLRIKSGSNYNYGWVRITVTPGGKQITIYDYAMQSIADSSIIAGDTGGVAAGISNHQLQNVTVYSSGKNVFVKYPNAREGMTITVTDLSGREVRTIQTTTELYEMNLSDAASGIYTITVRSKNAEMTKKVSIQ